MVDLYGDDRIKIFASLITFIFLIPYTASLFKGLGSLFQMAFDIPYAVCVIVMSLVTAVYVLIGGYMATAWNDFIQGIIMLIGIVAVIAAVLSLKGGPSEAIAQLSQITDGSELNAPFTSFFGPDFYGLVMVIILTSLGTWGLPQMVQKFYSIQSESSIRKGMIISTLFAIIVAGGCYFLGGFGRLFYSAESIKFDEIVPTMIQNISPILIALVLILVVSASMSTLSSLVLSSSSTITLDIIKDRRKNMSSKGQMLTLRVLCAFFIALSAVIAIIYDTYNISFIAQMMGVSWGALAGAFLAPFMYSLYWKRNTKASVISCFIFGVAMSVTAFVLSMTASSLPAEFTSSFIYKYLFSSPIYVGAWTMLLGFIIVPLVSLFTKAPAKETVEDMFKAYESVPDRSLPPVSSAPADAQQVETAEEVREEEVIAQEE
ncbi:MAG: sodium:solute symporter [Clostridia bacterium]|nr:sodium:solute symporter [Clostridia bacterium]